MSPVNQVCNGTTACVVSFLSWLFSAAFPIFTTLGAIAGSILAFHGIYMLLKAYILATKNNCGFCTWLKSKLS